jgi:pimeloyl-ACP methyl ester carboxylesterase
MRLPAALLLLSCLLHGGCAALLTEAVVSTPRRLNPLRDLALPIPAKALGCDERFVVPVHDGPTPVEISVVVKQPPNRLEEPRGTVLVLHGILAHGYWMLDVAEAIAAQGYRVVLVDLRGHGGSTGNMLTYGLHEARDLSRVIDELQARGLLAGKLGVFGLSYGATTAIHLAAIDARVAAVVATAPFADMRDEVPHYVRTVLPGIGHLFPDEFYQGVVAEAGRRASFDPADAAAEVAITRVTCPVLLLHGAEDLVVPPENSQRISANAPPGSQFVLLRNVGHFGCWLDSDGRVKKHTLAWFEKHL